MEKTRGFILKSLKYGDTSAIMQVYTEDYALISILIKGFFQSKNKNIRRLQFPFTEIEFSISPHQKSDLIIPKDLQISQSFYEMQQHPIKMIMLQFLAEILFQSLKNDDKNVKLYEFLNEQINIFNHKKTHFAEFHLILLMQLTSYFGFYPNRENFDFPYFDLMEGRFTQLKNAHYLLTEIESSAWKDLLHSNFSLESENKFNKKSRQDLIDILLTYYQLHVDGFREPKSLQILKEIVQS